MTTLTLSLRREEEYIESDEEGEGEEDDDEIDEAAPVQQEKAAPREFTIVERDG